MGNMPHPFPIPHPVVGSEPRTNTVCLKPTEVFTLNRTSIRSAVFTAQPRDRQYISTHYTPRCQVIGRAIAAYIISWPATVVELAIATVRVVRQSICVQLGARLRICN